MSYENFKPAVWSELIDRELEKSLVFGALANRKYEGEISQKGNAVTIPRVGATTIGDYDGSDITFQKGDGDKQVIDVKTAKYFALLFDDVDKAQALGALEDTQVLDAIYRLADSVDKEIAKLHTKISTATTVATTGAEVLAGIRKANTALNKTNVPKMGRWVVISSDVEDALLAELETKNRNLPQTNEFALQNGYIGKISGFEVFTSNNVVVSGNKHKCMAGTSASLTLAMQLAKVEAGRREKGFGDFVKGLDLFGCDVAETSTGKTNRLALIDVDLTPVTK